MRRRVNVKYEWETVTPTVYLGYDILPPSGECEYCLPLEFIVFTHSLRCLCVWLYVCFFVRWWSGGRSGTTSPPKDHWPTPAPTSGRWSGSKGSTLSPWLRQKRYKHKRFTGMWSVCVSVNSCCVWNTCNILYFCTIFATVLYITISIL